MKLYLFVTGILRALLRVFMFLKIEGKENVPKEGAFLLCANHQSNMDPVLIASTCPRQLTFMAKEELFKVFLLGKFIKAVGAFPIKRGKGDAAAVMATLKIMKRGNATLIFPEGTRMKNGERKTVNHGIIRLAMQCGVPILPAYVSKNSVTYGKCISYEEYSENMNDEKLMQSLADSLMDTIYSLH
jgi:1-acyl-sn-glycerol-3-phosphate acyltransferase